MNGSRGRASLWRATTAGLLLLASLILSGCTAPRMATVDISAPSASSLPRPASPERDEDVADPRRVVIPAIGVDAPVRALEVNRDGVLPAPATNDATGWWRAGPEPGERGPSVIAGHVDSYRGPAVFYRLTELRPGDRISVARADGSAVTFTVYRIARHAKNAFPTGAVYGGTGDPQLRLVTCGGAFDSVQRRYLDNVIVFAARSG